MKNTESLLRNEEKGVGGLRTGGDEAEVHGEMGAKKKKDRKTGREQG